MKKRVVVGMSGGVDSSAAACLLLEQGYDVIGVTMRTWRDETQGDIQARNGCCGLTAVDDARRVADCLGIPYYVLNFKEDFRKYVIDYFVGEYTRGRTPNPCIACNRYVKWESLLFKAKQLGADYIATGHYARVVKYPDTLRLSISRSAAKGKDQTYALYSLTQAQLDSTLLPLGDYRKEDIRRFAAEHNLPVAHKPDSQDICFVPDGDYASFIKEYTETAPPEGDFVDESGRVLGRHKGIARYTIGQRKGLGIAFGRPMYVKSIDAAGNTVTLSEDVSVSEMITSDVNWMALEPFEGERRFNVKIRYGDKAAGCTAYVERAADAIKIRCRFDVPRRAVTPGQAAVFYDGEYVAFGGVID
ncbi:MAG: tRNA 2-thiouridine(34) synthase MnmA [Clostridiales bacterium]|jgi:tRNA-specific 2-thiouridylase|nr:tRNA 2-thiouridine(34) synthase MnmA [Clostridiales bacterium]